MSDAFTSLAGEERRGYLEGILDHAERLMRDAVGALPDGVYTGRSGYENDCFDPLDVPIVAAVTIRGEEARVDFTGTGPQIRGFKNSSLANTYSSVYSALSTFFEPTIPRNEGTFRGVMIIAPEGSVVNARSPAPVTMCTVFPAQQIMHAVWEALGKAAPDRACAGWGMNMFPNTSGPDRDGRTVVMYHWGGTSAGGAVDGRDGFDQVGPMCTFGGLLLPNAEMSEQLFPVRIERQELRTDAAGAGEYRGRTGVEYSVDVLSPAEYSFRAEGIQVARAYGTNGGGFGRPGGNRVTPVGGETFEPPDYGLSRFGPARPEIASSGGGGWGDPLDRDPERVRTDVRDGVVSERAAEEVYGVVVETGSLDATATAARRARMRLDRNEGKREGPIPHDERESPTDRRSPS